MEMMKRFDIFLISLDLTRGNEIKKTRPYLIISPDEMNDNISTAIVAPMTSIGRNYPSRVACTFKGIHGQIVLDQIRTIDKTRLVKKLGALSGLTRGKVLDGLAEMFAP